MTAALSSKSSVEERRILRLAQRLAETTGCRGVLLNSRQATSPGPDLEDKAKHR